MVKTIYTNFSEINQLQTNIMIFVGIWAREKKTPIPLKEIMNEMGRQGVKSFTIVNAINSLLRKRYIRRAVAISNKSYFVQLKSV